MKSRIFRKFILPAIIGFCVGILILAIGLNFESCPRIRDLMDIIHGPAAWCARCWTYDLNLPPHGEAGFAVVPMVAAIAQWTLIGILIGFWRFIRS
jgi:hypothetical protein